MSSTYRDLQAERREVMQALLEMNCIPAGMELFPAADDDAWTLIKKVIAQSDYYLVVVGGRYGSTDDSGVSFTEREYEYALEQQKPVAAFLHGEPGRIPADQSEMRPRLRAQLEAFRQRIEGAHTVKYWNSAEDLGGKVARSINLLTRSKPAQGWVRAGQASPDLLGKLEQARETIDELRGELERVSARRPEETQHLAQGGDLTKLRYYLGSLANAGSQKPQEIELAWDAVFRAVAPSAELPNTDSVIHSALSKSVERMLLRQGALRKGVSVRVDKDDYFKVQYQLLALGLIEEYEQSHSNRPSYALSTFGRKYLVQLMAERRLAGSGSVVTVSTPDEGKG